MSIAPQVYLSFDGQCEAAFTFYEQLLGGPVTAMFTFGNAPGAGEPPPGWASKIMHATLSVDGTTIAGSDVPPDRYERSQGFQLMIEPPDPAETERVFAALADGGTVQMPLQETFWSVRFGVVTDRFGIPWSISCAQAPQAAA